MLKRAVKSVFKSIGYEIRARNYHQSVAGLDAFFELLERLHFNPNHIIDVGANHGGWTRTAMRYFPRALYTLVEPQQHLRPSVQDLEVKHQVRWINAGCADSPGYLPLAGAEQDHSSSFCTAQPGQTTILVEIKTLDQIVAGNPIPDLVKIDAEGYDLKVIEGAKSLLGKTDVFLVEAMICGEYENTAHAVI